ncbi:MAG TPA: autotransporter-associated beta strand repeat-containing protein, partial [Luteolibacter sp.]
LAQRSGTANYPNPSFAAIIGGANLKLDWLAPTGATSHDIYLNDRSDIVNSTTASGDFMGNFTTKPLDVEDAAPGYYYWRVDEHRDSTVFKGPIWSFQYLGSNGNGTISLALPTSWWVGANDSFLQSGVISGSGSFSKDGPGTLVLTATNTNSGSTIIRDGILQVGDGGTSGSLGSGPVTVYSTLAFNRSDNITFSGSLSGPGNVIQQGPGGLTLSGTGITYTGNTLLNGGSLTIAANPNFNSAIQINAGQLSFDTTGNYIVVPKVISGTGPVTIRGNSTNWTRFTADNSYTGGTLINSGGMLLLGNITPAGSVLGDIANNGTLGLYHSSAWTFSNNVSGTGALNLYSPSGNSMTVSGNTLSQASLNAYQNPGGILTNTAVSLSGVLNLGSNSTLTVASGANVTVTGGMTQLGNAYNGTMSTLKVTGGNLTFGGLINDGWDGAYTVTQTGGTVTTPGVTGGNGGGKWSTNTYNLQSGTLILGANGIYGPY